MQAIKLGECGFNKRKKYLFFHTKHTNYVTSIWICGQIFNDVFGSHVWDYKTKKKIHFVYKQQTSPSNVFGSPRIVISTFDAFICHSASILRTTLSFFSVLTHFHISKFSHHTMQFQLYFGAPTVMM